MTYICVFAFAKHHNNQQRFGDVLWKRRFIQTEINKFAVQSKRCSLRRFTFPRICNFFINSNLYLFLTHLYKFISIQDDQVRGYTVDVGVKKEIRIKAETVNKLIEWNTKANIAMFDTRFIHTLLVTCIGKKNLRTREFHENTATFIRGKLKSFDFAFFYPITFYSYILLYFRFVPNSLRRRRRWPFCHFRWHDGRVYPRIDQERLILSTDKQKDKHHTYTYITYFSLYQKHQYQLNLFLERKKDSFQPLHQHEWLLLSNHF